MLGDWRPAEGFLASNMYMCWMKILEAPLLMLHREQIGERTALVKAQMDAWSRECEVRDKLGSNKAESTGEGLD